MEDEQVFYLPNEEDIEKIERVSRETIALLTSELGDDYILTAYVLSQLVLSFQDSSGVDMISAIKDMDSKIE